MKIEFMSFGTDKFSPEGHRNRAVLSFDDKTKIEVSQFLSPETLAAIERDAEIAASDRLNLSPRV